MAQIKNADRQYQVQTKMRSNWLSHTAGNAQWYIQSLVDSNDR